MNGVIEVTYTFERKWWVMPLLHLAAMLGRVGVPFDHEAIKNRIGYGFRITRITAAPPIGHR